MIRKAWKLWLLAGILFLFSGVMHLIDKKYFWGVMSIFLGIIYMGISRTTYKNDNKSNQSEVSYTVMTDVDNYLRNLIEKGKEIEAIKYCRKATGVDLKKAKGYVDLLSKNK